MSVFRFTVQSVGLMVKNTPTYNGCSDTQQVLRRKDLRGIATAHDTYRHKVEKPLHQNLYPWK